MYRFLRLYIDAVFVWPVWIVWFLASAVAIIADPFDKPFQFTYWERVAFWPPLIAVAIVMGIAWRVIVREYLCPRVCALQVLLIALLASATLTPLILLELYLLVPGFMPQVNDAAMLAFYVLMISVTTSVLRRMAIGELNLFCNETPVSPPRLFDRLEPCERGSLWRMQVRDHYVDVITCQGSRSVLMRFSDAIAEVEAVPGSQVHRSHWVAAQAVTGVRSEKNKLWVTTKDGAEIPVSKTYRAEALTAGILPPN